MRILAIDYGQARMGLALSDELGLFAFPYKTLARQNTPEILAAIFRICEEEGVTEVVIGDPITHRGEVTEAGWRIRGFVDLLRENLHCPVALENERFSSRLAFQQGASDRDSGAACVILQGYLDRLHN